MTTAELCNLIIDKLRTGRVEFLWMNDFLKSSTVAFRYGHIEYVATVKSDEPIIVSLNRTILLPPKIETGIKDGNRFMISHAPELQCTDEYTRWIEGVLNGLVRDDDGNMVPR